MTPSCQVFNHSPVLGVRSCNAAGLPVRNVQGRGVLFALFIREVIGALTPKINLAAGLDELFLGFVRGYPVPPKPGGVPLLNLLPKVCIGFAWLGSPALLSTPAHTRVVKDRVVAVGGRGVGSQPNQASRLQSLGTLTSFAWLNQAGVSSGCVSHRWQVNRTWSRVQGTPHRGHSVTNSSGFVVGQGTLPHLEAVGGGGILLT